MVARTCSGVPYMHPRSILDSLLHGICLRIRACQYTRAFCIFSQIDDVRHCGLSSSETLACFVHYTFWDRFTGYFSDIFYQIIVCLCATAQYFFKNNRMKYRLPTVSAYRQYCARCHILTAVGQERLWHLLHRLPQWYFSSNSRMPLWSDVFIK